MPRPAIPRPSRVLIYGLVAPGDRCLFYIGKTHRRREQRLADHVEAASAGSRLPVAARIRDCLAAGSAPEIVVLERVPGASDWREAEMRHIRFWSQLAPAWLPTLWPPMTRKSCATVIERVSLTNLIGLAAERAP